MWDMTGDLFFSPALDGLSEGNIAGLLFCAILVLVILIFFMTVAIDGKTKRELVIGLAGASLSLFGVIALAGSAINIKNEREEVINTVSENRAAFLSDRGVYIPDSQMSKLEFPGQRPTEDEKFGIAQAEYQGKVISVFLTWEDGELKLYRTDGQELLPLN